MGKNIRILLYAFLISTASCGKETANTDKGGTGFPPTDSMNKNEEVFAEDTVNIIAPHDDSPDLAVYLLNIREPSHIHEPISLFDFFSGFFYSKSHKMNKVSVQGNLFLCIENVKTNEKGYIYIDACRFGGEDKLGSYRGNFRLFYQFFDWFNVYLDMENNTLTVTYQQIDEGMQHEFPRNVLSKITFGNDIKISFLGVKSQEYSFTGDEKLNGDLLFTLNLLNKARTTITSSDDITDGEYYYLFCGFENKESKLKVFDLMGEVKDISIVKEEEENRTVIEYYDYLFSDSDEATKTIFKEKSIHTFFQRPNGYLRDKRYEYRNRMRAARQYNFDDEINISFDENIRENEL
jgi:hypothetical protein